MKIVLLYGGQSAEHEISIISAFNVARGISYDLHQVQPIYITKDGQWLQGPLLTQPLTDSHQLVLSQEEVEADPTEAAPLKGQFMSPANLVAEGTDNLVVFPVLHGPNGEDGTIQGFLEVLDLPYVGAGVTASATGMDKIISKQLFDQAGLPQVPYFAFTSRDWSDDQEKLIQQIEGSLLYPLFVKPANMGSSVGISRVDSSEELVAAVDLALRYDRRIVVEQGISAQECEVAVLGNEDIHVSYVGKLVKSSDFYDYEEKYVNNDVQMEIPAELDPAVADKIQEYAIKAYRAIDGCGLSRADFFVTNNNDIYINEINTMPGFTPYSMYPVLWERTGISQKDLIEELIQLALRRHERKQALKVEG
ncbi:D-alanine--D-alanine ligase [Hutsoniella sourekii]